MWNDTNRIFTLCRLLARLQPSYYQDVLSPALDANSGVVSLD